MAETRTPKQIAAKKLDAEMRSLSGKLMMFGVGHGDQKLNDAGHQISSLRARVRVHMHPRDREKQNDG